MGSHVPATWQASAATHVTLPPAVHVPATQVSLRSHALPSLHVVPSVAAGFEQAPVEGLHVPATWHWSAGVHVTVASGVHVPATQVSLRSQALPSLHEVPSAIVGFEQTPVEGLHVPAAWHWSDAVHVTVLPVVHAPAMQVSLRSQAFPSLQAVPSGMVGFEQTPVAGVQAPATWHWSDGAHVTVLPAVHAPAWHVSFRSQALPSSHAVPFVAAGFVHVPVEGLHVPATWHWSAAAQVTRLPAVHAPETQVSLRSQAFPSLHAVPSEAVGLEQVPVDGLHAPATWHWSEAVHVTWLPAVHVPDWHVSLRSQALPSLQLVPFAAAGFEHCPVVGLHTPATWHWSDAVQVTWLPAVQTPAWHVSSRSQAFPSLQFVPFAAVGFEQAPVVVLHVPAT
jgi:hypothetical protein